jgi:lysophospholipase L1-like esterase
MDPRRLCLLLLLAATLASPAAALATVLPLGDSITRGDASADSAAGSYRYYLYEQLTAAGYDIDFVGSTTYPDFTRFSFDQDHDGHGGYTTETFLDDKTNTVPLKAWLAACAPPDVVLLMIGTNDAIYQVNLTNRTTNLRQIIGILQERNPDVTILLAKIIPTANWYRNDMQIVPYNNALPEIAANCSTPDSRVVLVDHYSGFDGVADTQVDGIHPNVAGMRKIAATWYAALSPLLPSPTPPTIPLPTQTPPGITVPGGTGPAGAPLGDGLYWDVNGNGRLDFADVVLFFAQIDWCAANAPRAFDFNANGRLDFADVVRLFAAVG